MASLAEAAADLLAAANRFEGALREQPTPAVGGGGAAEALAHAAGPVFSGEGFAVYVQRAGGHLLLTVNQTVAAPLEAAAAAAAASTAAPAAVGRALVDQAKLAAAMPSKDLYGGAQVLCLLVAFTVCWTILHYLMPLPQRGKLAGSRKTYWRRTLRAQFYYVGAAILGFIMIRDYNGPYELVYKFTSTHQVAFAWSIAHWAVATVEDAFSQSMLSQGLERVPKLGSIAKQLIYNGYFVHHLATIGILGFCLWMQCLSALAVCGFIFEAPVMLMNVREFIYSFGDFLKWPRRSEFVVKAQWYTTFALFAIGRGGPLVTYLYTNLYSQHILQTLPTNIRYVGHTAAIFFSILNFYIFNILTIWFREDMVDALAAPKKGGPDEDTPNDDFMSMKWDPEVAKMAFEAPPSGMDMGDMGSTDCVAAQVNGVAEAPPTSQEMGMVGGMSMGSPHAGAGRETNGEAEEGKKVKSAVKVQNKDQENKLKLARPYRYASYYDSDHSVEVQSITVTLFLISLGAHWTLTRSWGISGISASSEQRFATAAATAALCGPMALLRAVQVRRVPQVLSRCLSPLVHLAALSLVGLLASFLECLWSETPQLVNGAALALLGQQLLQNEGRAAGEYWLLLPITMWVTPWNWPCIPFAACLSVLPHAFGAAARDAWVMNTISVLVLTGLYGAGAVLVSWHSFADIGPVRVGLLGTFGSSYHYIVAGVVLLHLFVYWFEQLGRSVRFLSPFMAARSVCYIVFVQYSGDYLLLAAVLLTLRRLQTETRAALAKVGCDFRLMVVQEAFDTFRGLTLGGIWKYFSMLLVLITNFLLPEPLQVYAFPSPFHKTERQTSLGLCIYVSGPPDMAPSSFVCNVGNISRSYDGWYNDLTRTARSAMETLREFETSDKEELGLVSNLLCLIPIRSNFGKGGTELIKEFNFSAWKTPKHAFQWYKDSPAHKEIMAEHNNGSLKNFGNVLANMQLSKPLRWQARCDKCAALINKYPEVRRCECGGSAIDMPLF